MKKLIFGLVAIGILIVIVVLKANVVFIASSGKVVNSKGEDLSNVQVMYNYRCSSGETLYWQTENVTQTTDSNGQFQIPSYKSFKLSNIGAECSKQVIAYKENYSHYKNNCEQAINRIGNSQIANLDIRNACSDNVYVKPSAKTVLMRLDLINDAPNYDPSKPNTFDVDGLLR
ncbi:MAG: hypothetical protein Q7R78_00545 [bacterium]|nr:hypothetical protein [bacterium]